MPHRRAEPATVGTVERILLLKRLPTLGSLPARHLAVLAEHTHECHFPRGAVILRESEPVGAIHFVIDGQVEVTRNGEPVGSGGPGSAVGGLGLLARDHEGLGAVAVSETLMLELDADALLEVFEDHFAILNHILRETCGQIIELEHRSRGQVPGPPPRSTPLVPPDRDLDLVERIFLLRQAAPFRRSSINALAELSRSLTEARLEPGVRLWREGDPSGWILLVVNGSVECTSRGRGFRYQLGPGSPLGILEGLAGRPRWFEAVTRSRLVALQGHVEGLLDVFEDNPEMAMDYLAVMSRWLLRGLAQDPTFRSSTLGVLSGDGDPAAGGGGVSSTAGGGSSVEGAV